MREVLVLVLLLHGSGQIQDSGAKMIHLGKYTKSNIISKSIASGGGNATYRGTVKITKNAIGSKASVKCDTLILDDKSKSDTIPTNIVNNNSSLWNMRQQYQRLVKISYFI